MSDNKHSGRGFGGKGYYIALILCAAAIGITGYVYQTNTPEQEVLSETAADIPAGTLGQPEDIPVLATQGTTEATVPRQTIPPAQETQPKKLQTASPLAGEEIFAYSMEALSYNETTRDWRVHSGVDIAAEEGTEVLAAAEGQVYATYEDDALGHTVVIRHEGGYTTRYASLREDLAVSAGDWVELGDVLGYTGSSALVETAMGCHLHFGVTYRETPIDPAEFLALG